MEPNSALARVDLFLSHSPGRVVAKARVWRCRPVSSPETPVRENIPMAEYIRGAFVPLSHVVANWEMHSAVALTPAEERSMVREPAQAIPSSIVERLGKLRVLLVPYVVCLETGDVVSFSKPQGETHSSVWIETGERIHLVLSCRELDAHDTGFEFLASIAELARPRLSTQELDRFTQLLDTELRSGVRGEIDADALAAKQPLGGTRAQRRRSRSLFERYRDVALVSTLAEYMHGLWHDVQVRVGPEHLPVPEFRRRIALLAELFPPNTGYQIFSKELESEA